MDNQTMKCAMCGASFNSQDEMMKHAQDAHPTQEKSEEQQQPSPAQTEIKCSMCGMGLSNHEELSKHAAEKHAGGM